MAQEHNPHDPWARRYNDGPPRMKKSGEMETPEEMELRTEMEHFNGIVKSFKHYISWQESRFDTKKSDWGHLPERYKNMIPNMDQKFKYIQYCLSENQKFLDQITTEETLDQMMSDDWRKFPYVHQPKHLDLDKVKSTLRQCLRDWSENGEKEREMCYKPILDALEKLYPDVNARSKLGVLNPGCGLGRLTWEVARLGFKSQGNEVSYHMLLCSNLILNRTKKTKEFTLYPFIDNVTNVWRFRDQCLKIQIPEVHPRQLPERAQFSMVAGEFIEVYKEPNAWDIVVTCFFVDTAKNIFDYLNTLSLIIPPGGYWINVGPLLYHFEDMQEASVELTYEELRAIIPQFGFKFIEEKLGVSTTYVRNELSMLQMAYNSAFFICQREEDKAK